MGIEVRKLCQSFPGEDSPALDTLNFDMPEGKITGIVGPDGAGKTTLIRLLAGLLEPSSGSCSVLGVDTFKEQEKLYEIIGYMPQRFGLYEDLSVMQNLSLYRDLQGLEGDAPEMERLLHFAGLEQFKSRSAGALSGGMKQKLGLVCTMFRQPRVMLLDEPGVGVDPLSRRELWKMIEELREKEVTIVLATSYLDEAEKCDQVLLLHDGKQLFYGKPDEVKSSLKGRTFLIRNIQTNKRKVLDEVRKRGDVIDTFIQGDAVRVVLEKGASLPTKKAFQCEETCDIQEVAPTFEDAFVDLLGGTGEGTRIHYTTPPFQSDDKNLVPVSIQNLTKRFGDFTAVDRVSFEVKSGEVFGLLGPNGAGKTTTFKMLCGLSRATEGSATVAGYDMMSASSSARAKIGYMAQKFSLYENMTVQQNLDFFSGVYPLKFSKRKVVVEKMVDLFNMKEYLSHPAATLPLGLKQRLAISCSLMHEPDILFLDEPTSGVDPITRREFWYQINSLASQGVTILVTTHLMEEAEYCDRIVLMDKGQVIALDTPDNLKKLVETKKGVDNPTLEEAFIILCEEGERS